MPQQPSPPLAHPFRAWTLLVLAGIIGQLFHIDRGVLAILKTTLSAELGISNQGYSLLVSAFMLPYIGAYFFVGQMIHHWGSRTSITIFVGLMSVATLGAGFAVNLWQMTASRIVLGVAEAGVLPALFVALAARFPAERRGFAFAVRNMIHNIGGQVLAPLFIAAIALALGWRFAFWIPAAGGFMAVVLWRMLDRTQAEPAATSAPRASLRALLRSRLLWGLLLARMISDPFWFLLQFWQATYLQENLGLSLKAAGNVLWIPPLCEMLMVLVLGAVSDRRIRQGVDPIRARAPFLLWLAVLAPCAMLMPWVRDLHLAIVLLLLAQIMGGGWINLTILLAVDMAGKERMATVLGLMAAAGGITSIVLNAAAGTIVDHLGYTTLFGFGACLHPIAAVVIWRFYLSKRGTPANPDTTSATSNEADAPAPPREPRLSPSCRRPSE